jgi:hypothetical protein
LGEIERIFFFRLILPGFWSVFSAKSAMFSGLFIQPGLFRPPAVFALKWPCAGTPDHWFRELCVAECRAAKNTEDGDESLQEKPTLKRHRNPEINT